jgi:hypothetical protein
MNPKQQALLIEKEVDPVYFCQVCGRKISAMWFSEKFRYMVHVGAIVCSVEQTDLTAKTGEIWQL